MSEQKNGTSKGELFSRDAEPDDALFLLQWRNDVETRQFSRNSESITLDKHLVWFENQLSKSQSDFLLTIFELDGEPVGMTRLDRLESESFEISIVVSPNHRGQGLSKMFLSKTISRSSSLTNIHSLVAYIREDNLKSIKLFHNHGFIFQEDDGEFKKFVLNDLACK